MQMTAKDLGWIAASWIVYHLVNLALVAGLADEGTTWWEDFSDEFWFYTVATLAVLALSPLIAIVAVAYPYSWTLLPLLLLPLLAVQKAAEMSRHQEHQSLHDPLTGLPNRVLLNDRIEQALARSSRMRGMVVVMFLDLDLFKVVNDSLGHHAGDELLIDVAGRLKSAVRSGDTLARFGGDEFVVMCEDVTEDEVNAIAERITSSLRQSFLSDDRDVTVTASLGVAVATPKSTPQTLLRDADVAMYRAKEHGRNQVVMFDEAMHQQANERLLDAVGLRRALEHGEFRVVYQPVLDIATGRTIGMEALIRWDDPERGLVSPAMFIPAAEETGLIAPIGEWVLDAALADARMWRDQYGLTDMWVAVNISSRQLLSPTLADDVERALLASGVPATSLQLEITESAVMNDLEPVLDVLGRLRELGVSLAVDDFGTGYSSLAYLKRLPVTTLKIDRAFISGLGGIDDAFDRPIVDAILKMAQSLGLDVIAEGVETQDQRDALANSGGSWRRGSCGPGPCRRQTPSSGCVTTLLSGSFSHPTPEGAVVRPAGRTSGHSMAATLLRPDALASYIAVSARSSTSVDPSSSCASVTPTLSEGVTVLPSLIRTGSVAACRIFSAMMTAWCRPCRPMRTTTNSSPPKRAQMSSRRTADWMRCATALITASPAACPAVSLICLRLSRSQNSRPVRCPVRRLLRTASSRSMRVRLFDRPVRPSDPARRCSASSRDTSSSTT
jgi:diguanylate cyclase (GGDEF)-like protein